MRPATCGNDRVGGDARPPRPAPPIDDDPQPRHAGHEEHHAPGAEHQDGLAEIGLRDEQREHDAEQDHGEEIAGDVGLALVLGEQPGADDDEGGLQEFRRLDRDAEERHPALRALDLDADEEHRDHQHQHRGRA